MRLHVVDGTYELYRAHFSKRPSHSAPDGSDGKATVGIVAAMLALLQDPDEKVTHVAVAFDNPIRSFRNELCEKRGTDFYKSDEGVPPELRAQFDLAEEGIRAIGVTVWSMDRYEADDAMATAATRFGPEVDQVRILSPDKDLGQCVDGTHVVLVDRMRQKVIDETALRAARGIAPKSIPDFLALVGDAADGIPGLQGIGERTAAILLGQFATLERIPPDFRKWPPGIRGAEKIAATLDRHADDARFYRTLATLVHDVPLKESLSDLSFEGVPREKFRDFCARLGSRDLPERPHRWK
jgi:5'-3' exonuclease